MQAERWIRRWRCEKITSTRTFFLNFLLKTASTLQFTSLLLSPHLVTSEIEEEVNVRLEKCLGYPTSIFFSLMPKLPAQRLIKKERYMALMQLLELL